MSVERDCERCGEPIPPRRLGALPNTRLCIECSQAIGGDYGLTLSLSTLESRAA
jgi:Prokaryotic dksA/traR C4-type zinc finger